MPYGLHKLSGAANKMAALADYERACKIARERNRADVIIPLPAKAGHVRIDRITKSIVYALGDATLLSQFPDVFTDAERELAQAGERKATMQTL